MTGHRHVRLSGAIRVSLPPHEAFNLFTPSGERVWADDWDPQFLTETSDETEPGTVFQTHHGGSLTIWIVVRRETGLMIEYARMTSGHRAGLVRVTCEEADHGNTSARVVYDLTALNSEANVDLDAFAEGYPHFLEEWEQSIEQAIMRPRPLPPGES